VSGHTVREVLNRLRWSGAVGAGAAEIGILVRGDEGEYIDVVPFAAVVDILPAGVTLSGETFIPYHRIRTVRRGADVLWRARERRGGDEG
jgi:uncharacterized protein (UPF0248 family)